MSATIIATAVFVIVALVIACALAWGEDHSGTCDKTVTTKEIFPNIKPYDWNRYKDTFTDSSYSGIPGNVFYTDPHRHDQN